MSTRGRCASVLLAGLVFAGCGGATSTRPVKVPFVCHPKVPTPAGECIRQELKAKGIKPALGLAPVRVAAPSCVDISVWQGVPNLRAAGLRCVIIQTNDGGVRNGLFYAQVAAAKRAGIPWGVYTYMAPGELAGPQLATALSMSSGRGRTLGVWADAEQSGAYEHACAYTAAARAAGVHIYGVYSSPGLWPGYRCDGWIWPAEWGGGSAYPLPGYPRSAVILRQWCGTCRLPGFSGEVDRDESLGLLSLAKPPAPKPPAPRPTRAKLLAEREALRRDLASPRHRCRVPPWHGRGRYHHVCAVWLLAGQRVNRELRGQP